MKKEYKSSLFIIIKNIVYGIVGGAFAGFIATIWLDPLYCILIGSGLGLLLIYFAVFGDNIKLVIEDDKLYVYRFSKLKYEFNLEEVEINARIKTTYDSAGSDSDCTLNVVKETGETVRVDCSMLGVTRFYRLLEDLKITDNVPTKVVTKKKDK